MLDTAEGRHFVGNQTGVDAHHAVFQGFAHPESAGHVAGIEVGGQPEFGCIGHLDGFRLGLEAEQWGYGTEGFLPGDQHRRGDIGQYRGLEESAAQGVGLAAGEDSGALLQGVGHVSFHLAQSPGIDQGALLGAGLHAVANLERGDLFGQPLGKGIVEIGLNQEAIDADAGLAGIAVFGGDGARHGLLQIRIVEDDEGRIPAEFQGKLLQGGGALGHQQPAYLGGAGEGEFPYHRAGGESGADGDRVAGQHIEDPGGEARLFRQHGQGQRGQGRQLGGLDQHRATGSQGGRHLAGDHGEGEVPGGDGGADADGLLDGQDALVARGAGDGFPISTFGFLGEPFHKAGPIGHFTPGLGQGFAAFGGDQLGQVLGVFLDQAEPVHEQLGPGLGGQSLPGRPGCVGGTNGTPGFGRAAARNLGDERLRGRVEDRKAEAGISAGPEAIDETSFLEQKWVLKFHVLEKFLNKYILEPGFLEMASRMSPWNNRRGLLCTLLAACLLAACGGLGNQRPAPPTVSSSSQSLAPTPEGREVVMYALGLIGTDYRFGGKNPSAGLDCSGMVSYIFGQAAGLKVAGSAADIAKRGRGISNNSLRPGDLLFFNTMNRPRSHVGIYIGDRRFVHAPSSNGQVRIERLDSGYFASRFEEARTYFD